MTNRSRSHNSDNDGYGIGAVARLTGLTDHTIRAWERRYRAVEARRLGNGRRCYTAADVERLSLLKVLTDAGVSISSIAGDSTASLRERAASMQQIAAAASPERVVVAVLGGMLAGRLRAARDDLDGIELVAIDTVEARLVADTRDRDVDVVVVETAVLDGDALEAAARVRRNTGAPHVLVVYGFGCRDDARRARASGIGLLRSPVTPEELVAVAGRLCSGKPPARRGRAPLPPVPADGDGVDGPVVPRQFSDEQLAALASITSGIECECPQQLAQLVADLGAFELYSASCESRNAEDAALHRYLHRTTARARALVEAALKRVADAERLSY